MFNNRLLCLAILLAATLASCSVKQDQVPTITWSTVPIEQTISADEEIESTIRPYRERLDSIMNEVIGYAAHDLNDRGEYESNLGPSSQDCL